MKKSLNILALFILIHSGLHGQNVYQFLSADSMDNSLDPGSYFLNYLTSHASMADPDSNEADDDHQAARSMCFWQDRIPVGNDKTLPFLKYQDALKNVRGVQCTLPNGMFNGNWENIGPKIVNQQMQGLVYDIWVNPMAGQSNNIFIGAQDGGFWKTNNGGTDWNCVSDQFLNIGTMGVEAFSVNPFHLNDIYVGTNVTGFENRNYITWGYAQGIWHSYDAGLTWNIETNIPSNPVPTFQGSALMEFAPFHIKNPASMLFEDELLITVEGNSVLTKKVHGNTANPWVKLNWPSWIPPLFTGFRDMTVFTDPNGDRRLYLCADGGWSNGDPGWPPAGPILSRFFEIIFDQLGDIQAMNEIPINNGIPIDFGGLLSDCIGIESAYKGNGKIYVMTAAQLDEGKHALLEYDIFTGLWSPILTGWTMPVSTRNCMEIAVDPSSPDVIYYGNTVPCRIRKAPGTGIWQINALQPYSGSPGWHADTRKILIYHSEITASNPGINDIVYWGNDGGISKSIGNSFTNLNGNNLYLTETYDVGISPIQGQVASANMHDGVNATRTASPNNWFASLNGDGWDAKYDMRIITSPSVLLQHSNDNWFRSDHVSTGLVPNGVFSNPVFAPKDVNRGFPFPYDFDLPNQIMYMGNANMFSTTSFSGPPWTNTSNTGILSGGFHIGGAGTTSAPFDNCRSIAVATSDSRVWYYGMRRLYIPTKILFSTPAPSFAWTNITPPQIKDDGLNLTDIVVDPKNDAHVFISLGGVIWGNPGVNRVLESYNYGITGSWTSISDGLSELPVVAMVYQAGSDDIIYAATDAGVYRWDKPLHCWVHFNDGKFIPKIPNLLINDLEIDYCRGKLVAAAYGRGIWETDLYRPNPIPDIVETINLPGTTVWNQSRKIDGSILIKSGSELYITGAPSLTPPYTSSTVIHMPMLGAIYVEKGAKLRVLGAEITNTCKVWYGIIAQGDGSSEQVLSGTGFDVNHGVVILSKATLSNAEEAFSNYGGNDVINSGGIIQATGSYFYNNWRSASFMQYHNWHSAPFTVPYLQDDLSKFVDCKFIVDNNAPEGFEDHVTMWSVNGIKFFGNEFRNDMNLNQGHQSALYTIDASYRLEDCASCPPYSNNSKITGFYEGIRSDAFNPFENGIIGSPIIIQNTDFDQNEISMHLTNMKYPSILNNELQIGAKKTPIPSGAGTYQYYSLGSYLEDVSNFVYCNNRHTKSINPPVSPPGYQTCFFQYTTGLEIHNSGDMEQDIPNNSFEDLLNGIDCDMNCANSDFTQGIHFRCNQHKGNTKYDFLFQATPNIKRIQDFSPDVPGGASGNKFSSGTTIHLGKFLGNTPVQYKYSTLPSEFPSTITPASSFTTLVSASQNCANIECAPVQPEQSMEGLLSGTDFENMKNAYYSNENDYNANLSIYQQLIDAGDTYGTIDDIENANLSEAMQIRAEMLNRSPYVSQNVLKSLVRGGLLPNAFLLEIIMANPEGSYGDEFINYIQNEAPTPFQPFMLTMIENSWSGATIRASLESNMANSRQKMTELRNRIMTIYAADPNFYNEASMFEWMQKTPSLRNSYEIIEYLLSKKQYTQAQTMLTGLPIQYRFNTLDQVEYNTYVSLFNFKKNLLENDIKINQLDNNRIQQLQAIADVNDDCFPRAMARSALCFFYHICYPNGQRALPEIPQSRLKSINKSLVHAEKEIIAYPNPAKDYVAFYFNFTNKNQVKDLVVLDLMGKPVYKATLNGSQGQHIWNTQTIANGQYIYSINTISGEKYTGKLTIEK